MSEAVPLVAAEPETHAWHRTIGGWHTAFGLLVLLTGFLLLVDDEATGARRMTALAILSALSAWYGAVGVRALRSDGAVAGPRYVVVAIPLTVALFGVAPVGSLMLFMLYPHIWALLRLRVAAAGSLLTAAGTAGAVWARAEPFDDDLLTAQVMIVVSLVIALLLGLWITRIIEQSRGRARLVAELAETRADLAAVSREAGALTERERLAGDIHDTLAQGFVSIMLLLDAAEVDVGRDEEAARARIDRARHTAADNLAEARALIAALSSPLLQEAPLTEALRRLVDRFGRDARIESVLLVHGEATPLPAATEVVVLRTVQEALANVRRHAAADRVAIDLEYRPGSVLLRIADDGRGFDPAGAVSGFGLSSMRKRWAQVGGALDVDTAPDAGTTIRGEVPAWSSPS